MDPLDPEHAFRQAILEAAEAALGLKPEHVALTYPPDARLGDLATPVCFELARVARKAPRVIAEELVAVMKAHGPLSRVEAAGSGYINAFVDRAAFLTRWLTEGMQSRRAATCGKTIVEHTNINPNKAAHIGHLRNAVLGDTLVRFLRRLDRPVEVQNYIDDTGVQVADLVVGFRVLREEGLEQVRERYSEIGLRLAVGGRLAVYRGTVRVRVAICKHPFDALQ